MLRAPAGLVRRLRRTSKLYLRALAIRRMTEFEEENFTRLVLKKKDERQRRRDEEDIALGGVPTMARAGRRRGGLDDEFGDVLRSVGRTSHSATGDGYEELRQRGRKDGVLARSRKRPVVEEEREEGPKLRKRSRFEKEAKAVKRRATPKRK
jgi:U3 small nucleolar ribonucleoprotein protein LCP5